MEAKRYSELTNEEKAIIDSEVELRHVGNYGNYKSDIKPLNARPGKKYVRREDGSYYRYTTPTAAPIKTLSTRY